MRRILRKTKGPKPGQPVFKKTKGPIKIINPQPRPQTHYIPAIILQDLTQIELTISNRIQEKLKPHTEFTTRVNKAKHTIKIKISKRYFSSREPIYINIEIYVGQIKVNISDDFTVQRPLREHNYNPRDPNFDPQEMIEDIVELILNEIKA